MKKGVTLIELIFVIVVIGILSAVIAPSFTRPTLTEAANQLVSHIRYTQHLAMVDNKFDPNVPRWFKDRWQLRFSRSVQKTNDNADGSLEVWAYSIFSDDSNHDTQINVNDTVARNPLLSSQFMSGGSSGVLNLDDIRRNKDMALGEKFGIKWVSFSRSCSHLNPPAINQTRKIIFDNLGRPYWRYWDDSISVAGNPYSDMELIQGQCIITLCDTYQCVDGSQVQVAIEPETGYTHIL